MAVAIAGGFGGLGRAIVEAVLARGDREVFVLTRKERQSPFPNAQVAAVDYSDVVALTSLLEKNNVHTVISVVNNITGDNSSEMDLIRAADRSNATKRFIPSYFGAHYSTEQYESFPPAMAKKSALVELESSSLEWTTIYNGYFLDYFGIPKVKSYIDDIALFIDMPENTAVIPGSGEVPVVFTHTFDVAKFVAALLDSAKWPREVHIIGDRLTWNEMLKLAEEFRVTYDSAEKLESGSMTELPSHQKVYALYPKQQLHYIPTAFGLNCERGQANFDPSTAFNKEFPDMKPRTAREVMSEGWGS
ncbi:Nmra-like family [Fusarium albosuccineum]|uniref:Nmra-like family n=1 Tax=Fusarium albosuccineum TaxID=1237068 RepID=A0A8H4LB22_9HYPO|nr:Nmra-like family [Fusarium albosuccineum]